MQVGKAALSMAHISCTIMPIFCTPAWASLLTDLSKDGLEAEWFSEERANKHDIVFGALIYQYSGFQNKVIDLSK